MTPDELDRIRQHRYLVVRIARAFARRTGWLDPQEAEAWGLDGLAVAALTFEVSRDVPFDVFAAMKIRWAILDGYRQLRAARVKSERATRAWQVRPSGASGACATLTGVLAEHRGEEEEEIANALDQRDRAALVRGLCDRLPPREAAVIRAHYFEDRELSEIAEASGNKYSTVCQRHRSALSRLSSQIRRAAFPRTKKLRDREEVFSAYASACGAR